MTGRVTFRTGNNSSPFIFLSSDSPDIEKGSRSSKWYDWIGKSFFSFFYRFKTEKVNMSVNESSSSPATGCTVQSLTACTVCDTDSIVTINHTNFKGDWVNHNTLQRKWTFRSDLSDAKWTCQSDLSDVSVIVKFGQDKVTKTKEIWTGTAQLVNRGYLRA